MQPEYYKPTMKKPEFAEPEKPCYDYRNMEDAGKFRGVGQRGKEGIKDAKSIEVMPSEIHISKVRRDHNG